MRHADLGDVDLLLDATEYRYEAAIVLSRAEVVQRMAADGARFGPWAPAASGGEA